MNKKILIISVSLLGLAVIILVVGFSLPNFKFFPGGLSATVVQSRLVPEKVSSSAPISVALPNALEAKVAEQVVFEPEISGKWLVDEAGNLVTVNDAKSKTKIYYFQPSKALELGKYYSTKVNIATDQSLSEDFLVAPDPEILAILPADEEVLPETKISIVFNRPMIPLGRLDQFIDESLPVTITPTTEGRFKWISTNTLQFIPKADLISSAEYVVTVNSGFKSMDGLAVAPREAKFSTYQLDYYKSQEGHLVQNIVRVYNQPFLIRFNQPVDLEKAKTNISINSNGKSVPFSVAYAEKLVDDKKVTDFNTLELHPEDAGGRWQTKQNYAVKVSKAYPKSGGNIIIDRPATINYQVGSVISHSNVISPRGPVEMQSFDPLGTLNVGFYEEIDLDKSQIAGSKIAEIVYGEKCDENSPRKCLKVPNKKEIIISFKSSLKSSEKFAVSFEKVISVNGDNLGDEAEVINLKVYDPLVIYNISSGDYLDYFTICSNNSLKGPSDDGTGSGFNITPPFEVNNFGGSYLVRSQQNQICKVGQYSSQLFGYLVGSQKYNVSAKIRDSFGGEVSGNYSFTSRAVRESDYQILSHQESGVVTVPSRTKLTFSAKYLPSVSVSVCRLNPTNFNQARESYNESTNLPCDEKISKIIPLVSNNPESRFFTVDLKDYFPNVIGNYLVSVDSSIPISTKNWQSSARTLVSVTNLIVTEKKINPSEKSEGDSQILNGAQLGELKNLYWVIDASTREPVVGAIVGLYRKGALISSAVTDLKGLAFVSPVPGADMTVITSGQDKVVLSNNVSALSWARRAVNDKHYYLYTDKPIYRPGQEVNIKGFYRLGYDGYYQVPAGQTVVLKITDSSGKIIKEESLQTNSYGSIATNFKVEDSAPLGSYRACVGYQCATFEVLNYAPAAFKVALNTDGDEFTFNNQPKVNLKADYYFGVPVSGATVDYHLSSQYYYFAKYTSEYFNFNNIFEQDENGYSEYYYYGDNYLGNGKAVLNEDGEVTIEPNIKVKDLDNPSQSKIIILDATVKNQTGRSISSQKSYILHVAPIYLGSKVEENFAPAGTPISLKVKSVNTSGESVSLGGIEAEVYKVNWVEEKRPAGNGQDYSVWKRERKLVKTENFRTNNAGDATVSLVVSNEGEYEVDVKTGGNQAVGSRTWFYLYGNQNVNVRGSDDTSLKIKAEKKDLNIGEKGKVVMEIPEGKAKALVTIERGRVFTYEVIDIKGNLANYEFPVTADYYPNVHLSVVLYAPDRAVRYGAYDFKVVSKQKNLKISITTDKKVYKPGDDVVLVINASDEFGRPQSAELTLAVVDMSVLALRGNPKKSPVDELYGNVPLTVATYSNFKNLLKYIDPVSADGKGGSGNDPNSGKRRGVFKEVAFWKPNLVTDSFGRASVTFKLPDNLTTWQVEAVGMTFDTKVGAGYQEFSTKKLLMVTPLKPRFVLPGDEFSIGAQVFNQSENPLNLDVTLTISGLEIIDKANKSVSIKKGETKTIYWNTKVPTNLKPGFLTYSLSATGGGLSDIVDDTLKVNANTLYGVTATAGKTTSRTTELVYVPDTILPDQGELVVESSATLAVYLPNALKYFLEYPYECAEQKSSRLGALALISKAIAVPNLINQNLPELEPIITKNLDSLYALQNSDGGFRMWSESRDSNYSATIEVVNAFDRLSQIGYKIDNEKWRKATDYLFNYNLKNYQDFNFRDSIILIGALLTQDSYLGQVQGRGSLDLEELTMEMIKDKKLSSDTMLSISEILHRYQLFPDQMKKIDSMLKNRLVIDSRGTFLDSGSEDYGTAVSNTARHISIFVMNQDKSQVTEMLRWLVASRDKDGAWGSTKNTLAGVKAITDYLTWQPETSANFTLENRVNEQVAMEFTFGPKSILTQLKKVFPLGELRFGELNSVNLGKKNQTESGNTYYSLVFKYFLPANEAMPRDEGLSINRNFFALDDKDNAKPLAEAKVGEVMRAQLEIVVPVTRRNVAIEDFIPAGLEIIDTSLSTENQTLDDNLSQFERNQFRPSHYEWRDDRAFIFRENLKPGTYKFDYLVRALVPGDYLHLPAQIWEMDNPENFGRSNASRFSVK